MRPRFLVPALTLALFLALTTLVGEQTAYATDGKKSPVVTIRVERTTPLTSRPGGTAGLSVTPQDTYTDLGGGVTATSIVGLQYQEGIVWVDVKGMTMSATNAAIQEMETHGALIHSYSRSDCYYGDYLWTQSSLYGYNTTWVGGDYGPWSYNNAKSNCFTMTSGHYYINNGARTDVPGPDAIKTY